MLKNIYFEDVDKNEEAKKAKKNSKKIYERNKFI